MSFKKFCAYMARLPLLVAAAQPNVGGQALIEGVMMRGKFTVSWAVRAPDGAIVTERFPFVSITKKHPLLAWPIVRGCVNLFESMSLGYKALNRSTEIAYGEVASTEKKKPSDTLATIATFVVALVIAMGIFMYLPMWIPSLFIEQKSSFIYNLVAGGLRIVLLLAYMHSIGLWKEIRRVYQYHGAEHKAIFAFEAGKELSIANTQEFSTFHPRCGTSFLFLVGFICVLLFSVIDTFFIKTFGPYPSVFARFIVHLALIPLVSGISYEVLKFSSKHSAVPVISFLIQPGLWLQRITTKKPDDAQVEVAIAALKAVI